MDNQEFIMEEVLTKNYGMPTQITDEDLLTPIEDMTMADGMINDYENGDNNSARTADDLANGDD
jgi:hypothetical protein